MVLSLGSGIFLDLFFSQGGRKVMRLTANQFYAGSTPVPESTLTEGKMYE